MSESPSERARRYYAEFRGAVLDHYGRVCVCCGTADRLTIDHVNGDGFEMRAAGIIGTAELRRIVYRDFPDTYQILCRRCNSSKGRGPKCRLHHGRRKRKRIPDRRAGVRLPDPARG